MKLFFRKYGSGPPLIILHGLYGSSDNWVSIAVRLSSDFTVLLPDQRNHGQSPHSQIHTYDAMAADLHELTEELHMDKFLLAGHSMGGKTAMKFALKWPEKLNGLVIVDVSPFGSPSHDNPFFTEHKQILESLLSIKPELFNTRTEIEDILSSQISSEKTRGFIMKNLKRRSEGNFEWKLNAPSLLANLSNITDGVTDREQSNLTITGFPVVFVRGGNSDYITNEDINLILKVFPAAEIITIPETGHWIHAEKPERIAGIFLDLKAGN